MLIHGRLDEGFSLVADGTKSAELILAHQTAVALDVGSKNGNQPTFHVIHPC
jgi:hypothetical protein